MSRRPRPLTDVEIPHFALGTLVRMQLGRSSRRRGFPPLGALPRHSRSPAGRIAAVAGLVGLGFGLGWLVLAAQALAR